MSGSVSNLFVCPKCQQALSSENRPEKCPNCNFRFREPDEALAIKFSWGKDPSVQFFEMVQQKVDSLADKPLHELIPGITKEESDQIVIKPEIKREAIKKLVTVDKDAFFLSTRADDVEGWFKTLHYLMSVAIISNNRELVVRLGHWGEQIGEMAKVLKDYTAKGGNFFESNIHRKDKPEGQI